MRADRLTEISSGDSPSLTKISSGDSPSLTEISSGDSPRGRFAAGNLP